MQTLGIEKASKSYSLAEEIANAVSHGIGALLSVAGLTLLLVIAAFEQDATKIVSFSIYGTSLVPVVHLRNSHF
jgi:hemolysin III